MNLNENPDEELNIRISADILLKQFDITWNQIKHISIIEIGSLAAWHYLYSEKKYLTAILLMLFSCSLLFTMLAIIRRQVQLQEEYYQGLRKYLINKQAKPQQPLSRENWKKIPLLNIDIKGHVLARLIPIQLIITNIFLALFTLTSAFTQNTTIIFIMNISALSILALTSIILRKKALKLFKFLLVD